MSPARHKLTHSSSNNVYLSAYMLFSITNDFSLDASLLLYYQQKAKAMMTRRRGHVNSWLML